MKRTSETEAKTQNLLVVTTVMASDLLARLNGESHRQGKSRSLLIRQACEQFLRKVEQGEQMEVNANG